VLLGRLPLRVQLLLQRGQLCLVARLVALGLRVRLLGLRARRGQRSLKVGQRALMVLLLSNQLLQHGCLHLEGDTMLLRLLALALGAGARLPHRLLELLRLASHLRGQVSLVRQLLLKLAVALLLLLAKLFQVLHTALVLLGRLPLRVQLLLQRGQLCLVARLVALGLRVRLLGLRARRGQRRLKVGQRALLVLLLGDQLLQHGCLHIEGDTMLLRLCLLRHEARLELRDLPLLLLARVTRSR